MHYMILCALQEVQAKQPPQPTAKLKAVGCAGAGSQEPLAAGRSLPPRCSVQSGQKKGLASNCMPYISGNA